MLTWELGNLLDLALVTAEACVARTESAAAMPAKIIRAATTPTG
jgi:succinate dehydrogenase/fumarate reductase flavoprotein subunit